MLQLMSNLPYLVFDVLVFQIFDKYDNQVNIPVSAQN